MPSVEENEINENGLFDEELEQQLLGGILINNNVLQNIELDIKPECFYFSENRKVFETIKYILQNNQYADEKTVYYNLIDTDFPYQNQELKDFISKLIDAGAGSLIRPKEIVKILSFLSVKRKLTELNKDLFSMINKNTNELTFENNLGELERKIYSLRSNNYSNNYKKIDDFTQILKDKLKKAKDSNKDIAGIKSGFKDLDQYTGGLQKSDLIIIAARPSMGKTALAINIAKNVAQIMVDEAKDNEQPQGVAVFSLEMSGEQIAGRVLSMASGFSTKTIHTARYDEKDAITGEIIEKNKKISDRQWNIIIENMEKVSKLPLYIDDTPALSVSVLRSRARFLKTKYNICAIVIDYLQLLRPSKDTGGNRVLEIAEITSTLKAIAKELDIPVVALSQLSRSVEKDNRNEKKPQLSDLRDSGTIEQDADIVMMLYREGYYELAKKPKITENSDEEEKLRYAKWQQKYDKIKNEAEIIVAKNRNGPVGTVLLNFDMEHMLFTDNTKQDDKYNINNTQQQKQIEATNSDFSKTIENNDSNNLTIPEPYSGEEDSDDYISQEIKDVFS